MPGTWTVVLSRHVAGLAQHLKRLDALEVGDRVLVRRKHSPLALQSGRIVDVAPGDTYGPYLVEFDSGLRFRYERYELSTLTSASQTRETEPALMEKPLY